MRIRWPDEDRAGWGRILCILFSHPDDRVALKMKPRGHIALVCLRCGDEL